MCQYKVYLYKCVYTKYLMQVTWNAKWSLKGTIVRNTEEKPIISYPV